MTDIGKTEASLTCMRPTPGTIEAAQTTNAARDVLTPRDVADRSRFSYQAILRAIRRGDLHAYEPVPGRYRIAIAEYERWLRTPRRQEPETSHRPDPKSRHRARANDTDPGSFARLTAIEGGT
jgi:hypothetical protein